VRIQARLILLIYDRHLRFGETVLNVIEKTSKVDKYTDKMDKYSALTPEIRIHYQTVYK
jgi:hypothetical protein